MKIFQFDITKRIFLCVCLALNTVSVANAAPLGGDPTQGYCQTVDGGVCGWGGGSRQPVKVINIPSRYGAVAFDGEKGIVGVSDNNLKSVRSAKKEAVQKCISYGGTKDSCKIIAHTKNGCIALALGKHKDGGGISAGGSNITSNQAENDAMQNCSQAGGRGCFIAHSQCSRDPRYRVGK